MFEFCSYVECIFPYTKIDYRLTRSKPAILKGFQNGRRQSCDPWSRNRCLGYTDLFACECLSVDVCVCATYKWLLYQVFWKNELLCFVWRVFLFLPLLSASHHSPVTRCNHKKITSLSYTGFPYRIVPVSLVEKWILTWDYLFNVKFTRNLALSLSLV